MENSFGFCTTVFCKASRDLQLSGHRQLSRAPPVVRVPTVIERTYSCLDYESTSSCPKYLQLSRAPPVVQSTSSCREHLQLSKVSPVVQSTSSCPKYLQLSITSPVIESTPSCREYLHLSKTPPVVKSDFCQTESVNKIFTRRHLAVSLQVKTVVEKT